MFLCYLNKIFQGTAFAQVFGATPTLGGVIGAVVMLTGMNPEAPLKNLFLFL
ncbi:hypothetical protein EfmAA818_07020 [Enterococcus faecium]|nr:hypothetical protein EfmAA818_07020 [Enterococcus faecium]